MIDSCEENEGSMNKIGREIETGGSIKDDNYKKNTLYIGLVKYLWSIIALRSIFFVTIIAYTVESGLFITGLFVTLAYSSHFRGTFNFSYLPHVFYYSLFVTSLFSTPEYSSHFQIA